MVTMSKTKVIHFTLLVPTQESMKLVLTMKSKKEKLLFKIFKILDKKVILKNSRAMYNPMLINKKSKVKLINLVMIMNWVRILLRRNHQELKSKIQS